MLTVKENDIVYFVENEIPAKGKVVKVNKKGSFNIELESGIVAKNIKIEDIRSIIVEM
jgi:hypothetical protein